MIFYTTGRGNGENMDYVIGSMVTPPYFTCSPIGITSRGDNNITVKVRWEGTMSSMDTEAYGSGPTEAYYDLVGAGIGKPNDMRGFTYLRNVKG